MKSASRSKYIFSTISGGAPKIGKSWIVLELCVRIAKGETLWGMPTTQGTTLYLCLEDTLRRVQERLLCITDEVPANTFFATAAGTLADGLCHQIRQFKEMCMSFSFPEDNSAARQPTAAWMTAVLLSSHLKLIAMAKT